MEYLKSIAYAVVFILHIFKDKSLYAPSQNENQTQQLKILTIKSTGLSLNGITTISISYVASPDHYVHWIGSKENGGTWNGGTKIQSVLKSEVYTSTVDAVNLTSLRSIYFRLFNNKQSISIRLNLTAVESPQEQVVTQPHSNLIKMKTSYIAPKDSDLTITGIINLNSEVLGDFSAAEIFFEGLNRSVNPPIYFDKYSFNSDGITVNWTRRTNDTTNYHIILDHSFVKYGGFLTLRVPYAESSKDKMIDEYLSGLSVKVFAYGLKDVIPFKQVGIMPLKNQTIIFPPSSSIRCLTIGNPRPTATIFKKEDNGEYKKLVTNTAYIDKYSILEVKSLSANRRESEGRYICRVSNGYRTVESETDAVILTKAVIDESMTGILENTSKAIIVSCKATGRPRPELEFRLYEEYGPFMIRSGLYQFRKSESGLYTSQLTMTLSAVGDVDVHTVYCLAAQGDERRSFEISKKINIFPEGKDISWDLYTKVAEAGRL